MFYGINRSQTWLLTLYLLNNVMTKVNENINKYKKTDSVRA